ncbi:MAG TPA: hypothetical protein VJS43_08885, partial [Candidatus Acidoferrales bacterium]|nr:hypothetical protein [Candidatus Acidoferrales bacterium]
MSDRNDEEPIISMVLLLRVPHYFTKEELQHAAERAWRIAFGNGDNGTPCVLQRGNRTVMRVGTHVLTFAFAAQPYLGDPGETSKSFGQGALRTAWAAHRGWAAVDYFRGGKDKALEYAVLAKIVAEMLDENCTGIFLPAENQFTLNDRMLYGALQEVAAARDAEIA